MSKPVECPQCGSDAVVHEQKAIAPFPAEFIVVCGTCINKGPWRNSEREAIEAWNENKKRRPR